MYALVFCFVFSSISSSRCIIDCKSFANRSVQFYGEEKRAEKMNRKRDKKKIEKSDSCDRICEPAKNDVGNKFEEQN